MRRPRRRQDSDHQVKFFIDPENSDSKDNKVSRDPNQKGNGRAGVGERDTPDTVKRKA